ncbi:uncharacterized protein LOC134241670 [Saccostrea cucullata]|uniref:uncharacterized protein LOC134241670 n=1 Tax=Saccostrea cuccullata TaxID=36930 RepID=UPI002ED0E5DA
MQNFTKCELSCPDDRPLLFNKTCRSTCPPSSPFTSLRTSVFNKIFVCSEHCNDMMASYRNVCVSVLSSQIAAGISWKMCPREHFYIENKQCVNVCSRYRRFRDEQTKE